MSNVPGYPRYPVMHTGIRLSHELISVAVADSRPGMHDGMQCPLKKRFNHMNLSR